MDTNDIEHLFLSRPALIIGSRATSSAVQRSVIYQDAKRRADGIGFVESEATREDTYRFFDELRAWDRTKAEVIEKEILSRLSQIEASPDVKLLAAVNWSVIVSLSVDTCLEQAIQSRIDRTPSGRTMTVVSHPSTSVPIRSLPVIRLLGDHSSLDQTRRMALGASDLFLRRQTWHDLLARFADYAKNASVLILGLDERDNLTLECLATLISAKGPIPTRFVFVGPRQDSYDPTLLGVIRARAEVKQIDCSLQALCNAASKNNRAERSREIPSVVPSRFDALFSEFSDLVSLPITKLPEGFVAQERKIELCDALFRPLALDWRPYILDMDLKREQQQEVLAKAIELVDVAGKGNWPSISILGDAGVGKTTFLKRIALELAKKGMLVCWIRKRGVTAVMSAIKQFARKLREMISAEKVPPDVKVVFVIDDPISLDVNAGEIPVALESVGLPALTIVASRNSDDFSLVPTGKVGRQFSHIDVQLSYTLSEPEVRSLELFLVRNGIASSSDAAKSMVRAVPDRLARDILCSLWFLVPATKVQLEASLESEYLRLGSPRPAVESLASNVGSSAGIAKRAYEAVAVASSLDIPLPIEVLVRAVSAGSYQEWLEQYTLGKAVWGLLYDDFDPDDGVLLYRTRNQIVTDVLVRLIDGGIGHSGRYRVLKALLEACRDGGDVYRSFLTQVLVRRRERLAQFLTLKEGFDLYELAIEASPSDEGLLLHHQGIWVRTVGNDPEAAYQILQKALNVVVSDRSQGESRENIHVSMAAAIADKLEKREIDPDAALAAVQMHLAEARLKGDFDPHVPYLQARTLLQIARNSVKFPTTVESACKALSEIDRGLLSIGSAGRSHVRYFQGIERLLALQRSAWEMFKEDELEEISSDLERDGNLFGAELRARLLLRKATVSKKGSDYNIAMNSLDEVLSRTSAEPWQRQLGLREARAVTMIRWRITTPKGVIDWEKFRHDVEFLLRSPLYSVDPLWHYYRALALFHLGDITTAMSEFSSIRPLLRSHPNVGALRNFFLGKEGFPRQLQAEVHVSHGKRYASIPSLGIDAEAPECPGNLRDGDTAHCYLVFRLAGHRAYFGNPNDLSLEIIGDSDIGAFIHSR